MSGDCEAELVAAMRRCGALAALMVQQGVRRGAQTAELAAELGEIRRLGARLCAGGWTPDAEIVDLTRRVDRVSDLMLEEISCGETFS